MIVQIVSIFLASFVAEIASQTAPINPPVRLQHINHRPLCINDLTYDDVRSRPEERCLDASKLQEYMLKREYRDPANIKATAISELRGEQAASYPATFFLPRFDLDADDAQIWKTLLSMITLKDARESLVQQNATLSLMVLDQTINDSCEWMKTNIQDFNCTPAELNVLKHKLELYMTISDVATSSRRVSSPLERLANAKFSTPREHLCNYWSSHVMRNCTRTDDLDLGVIEANNMLRNNLGRYCTCTRGGGLCTTSTIAIPQCWVS